MGRSSSCEGGVDYVLYQLGDVGVALGGYRYDAAGTGGYFLHVARSGDRSSLGQSACDGKGRHTPAAEAGFEVGFWCPG